MNKVFIFCILSIMMLGNEMFAQNSTNANISFLNSLIKEGNDIWIEKCFIRVSKSGYNDGIIGTNGKWIIEQEVSNNSVRTDVYTDYTGKLLLYSRWVKNDQNECLTYKAFDLSGKLLFDETSYDENGKYEAKGRMFKAMLKYLLNSDKDIQTNLLTDKDFGYARFCEEDEGAIKALEDGYVMFSTSDSGYAKLKGTFAINRDGKILTDIENYCGNHIFYLEKGDNSSFVIF